MITVLAFLAILFFPEGINAQSACPEKYRRLSKDHSFCKPPNPKCKFLTRGIQNTAEIQQILDIHNNYRNRVATGQETEAIGGRMPTASNMLEMTWDAELAEVAQKWAEQCHFKHDCGPCRATKSFSAGQNIAYMQYQCSGNHCDNKKADWKSTMKMFYDEVKGFNKGIIKSMDMSGPNVIGHFTQVIWAESYKVGCGYVAYQEGESVRQFYVCNYGPAGNMFKAPIYKEGRNCSKCPTNSCCGSKCTGGKKVYSGLCRLSSTPPVYSAIGQKPLYLCSFKKGDPSCQFQAEGNGKWELSETASGTFLTAVVRGGGSFTAHFHQTIKVRRGVCMNLSFRKGPNVAGDKEVNKLEVIFEQNGKKSRPVNVWSYSSPDFIQSAVQVEYDGDIKISIKYSAPADAPSQYLDMKQIEITNDGCKNGK